MRSALVASPGTGASSCTCGATWRTTAVTHCAACHQTFQTIRGYELHRPAGSCLRPQRVGLELRWIDRLAAAVWCLRRGRPYAYQRPTLKRH